MARSPLSDADRNSAKLRGSEDRPVDSLTPLERATRLREEAGRVMSEIGLPEAVRPYGPLVVTGSCFLDLMVYPDLDLMFPRVSIEQLFQIAARLARSEKVFQVVFERSREPGLPAGLYLKPRIEAGQWGRPWKIDLWSLDPAIIDQRTAMMQSFKDRLTPALREHILRYKLSVMTAGNRTPMHSGYFIYKAFLDEGLSEFEQVTQYLRANGIRVG
jgi:hypothetical protein